ncbi:MAG: OadG family protein [Clostridia bacterium]|nr:OadG family protein [Clostridia bacterium]
MFAYLMAEPSNAVVVLLGMGIVFVGLVCLVVLCAIMGKIFGAVQEKQEAAAAAPAAPAAAPAAPVEIPNRGEFIAAVSAAIAEELGADVSAIRILSVKRV